jgi:putative addiction module component (TIGR02574 family)
VQEWAVDSPGEGQLELRLEDLEVDAATQQLFDAALSLPDDDRVELVEALIASFRPDDRPPFDDSWRAVFERRSAELQAGRATPVPWAEVKRSAREKAGD